MRILYSIIAGVSFLFLLTATGQQRDTEPTAKSPAEQSPLPPAAAAEPQKDQKDGKAAQTGESKAKAPLGNADPYTEMVRRVEREAVDRNYASLKAAAAELAETSMKVRDEIIASGPFVVSVKLNEDLNHIDKVSKTLRDKAKGP